MNRLLYLQDQKCGTVASSPIQVELLVDIERNINANYKVNIALGFHVTASTFLVGSKVATLTITKGSGASQHFQSGSVTLDLFFMHAEISGVIHFRRNKFRRWHTVDKPIVHGVEISWKLDYGYRCIFAQVGLDHVWLDDGEHISHSLLTLCAALQ
jgi:hypothetical protein